MQPHLLTNFEIKKCHQNKTDFNDIYPRNNLSKIKDRTLVINLDEFKSLWTRWIALSLNDSNITYVDSFGVQHIPK